MSYFEDYPLERSGDELLPKREDGNYSVAEAAFLGAAAATRTVSNDLIRASYEVASLASREAAREAVSAVVSETRNIVQDTLKAKVESEVDPLLRRAFIFLEDSEFERAEEYFDRVLDLEPETPRAYLGLLMAQMKLSNPEEVSEKYPCDDWFGSSLVNDRLFSKALRFASHEEKWMLNRIVNAHIEITQLRLSEDLESALARANGFLEMSEFGDALNAFEKACAVYPKCFDARYGVLLASVSAKNDEELIAKTQDDDIESAAVSRNDFFRSALEVADESQKAWLETLEQRQLRLARECLLEEAIDGMKDGDLFLLLSTREVLEDLVRLSFDEAIPYLNNCNEAIRAQGLEQMKAEYEEADAAYSYAEVSEWPEDYLEAAKLFAALGDYSDAKARVHVCNRRALEAQQKEHERCKAEEQLERERAEARRKRREAEERRRSYEKSRVAFESLPMQSEPDRVRAVLGSFESLGDYELAVDYAAKCQVLLKQAEAHEEAYAKAMKTLEQAESASDLKKKLELYRTTVDSFSRLAEYRDSSQRMDDAKSSMEKIKSERLLIDAGSLLELVVIKAVKGIGWIIYFALFAWAFATFAPPIISFFR